jgi:hypothetical protein
MTTETDTRCIAVFTSRSPHKMMEEGGSQSWVLDPVRVRLIPFLVCVQNKNDPRRKFSDDSEAHGSVFMVARISDVVPAPEDPKRWQICFDRYWTIQNPTNVWKGQRNPVKYTTLEAMGIDLRSLGEFHSVDDHLKMVGLSANIKTQQPSLSANESAPPISIANAKLGLAAFYGVPPDAIEILIRG